MWNWLWSDFTNLIYFKWKTYWFVWASLNVLFTKFLHSSKTQEMLWNWRDFIWAGHDYLIIMTSIIFSFWYKIAMTTFWMIFSISRQTDSFLFTMLQFTRSSNILACLGMKLKCIAQEWNEDRQAAYIIKMPQYTPHQNGFLNETSKDKRTTSRAYGRSKCGCRAQKKQVFLCGQWVSTEASLSLDGIVVGTAVEGSMTYKVFLDWMEFNVVSAYWNEYYCYPDNIWQAA